jgi:hypothetical protein
MRVHETRPMRFSRITSARPDHARALDDVVVVGVQDERVVEAFELVRVGDALVDLRRALGGDELVVVALHLVDVDFEILSVS